MRGGPTLVVLVALIAGCAAAPGPSAGEPAGAHVLLCGPACDVDADATEGAGAEPSISVDPRDPLHAVIGSFTYEFANGGESPTRFWLHSHVTFDGGATWESRPLPGGLEAGPAHPLASYSNAGDPAVVILPGGKVLYAGVIASGVYPHLARNDLFVARSDDGGLTYPRIDIISRGAGLYSALASNGPQNHIPFFARGADGTIMLAWVLTNAPGMLEGPEDQTVFERDLLFSLSRDDGETWSAPSIAARRFLFGPSPLISPDGSLHIAYYRFPGHSRCCGTGAQFPTDIFLTSSDDGGATWNDRPVAEGSAMSAPSLAIAPGGRLYLATVRAEEPEPAPSTVPNHAVPLLLWSDDAGATWSEPLVLDVPPAPGNPLPRLAIDPASGVAYVVYYAPTDETQMEVRAVAFVDGALRAPLTLTKERIEPGAAQRDYLGLDATADGVLAAWVGGRWPDTDIHVARLHLAAPE